jgi:hypothetical protein
MALSPAAAHHRSRIAALSRDREPDDPEIIEARRALRAQRISDYLDKALDGWPELTEKQLDDIAALLRLARTGKRR